MLKFLFLRYLCLLVFLGAENVHNAERCVIHKTEAVENLSDSVSILECEDKCVNFIFKISILLLKS